jgi:4a-hydroxytetrahydrobiopterin dehydratase
MTEALASKTCTPCRGGIPPLTREQAELFHAETPDWQLPSPRYELHRTYGRRGWLYSVAIRLFREPLLSRH